MKYREKKDGEVEHSKEQNAASDLCFGMANYAGAVSADSSAVYCYAMVGSLGTQATAAVGQPAL